MRGSTCDHLSKLIQLDVDAVCTYREALLHATDPAVRSDLHAFLAEHEQHVRELSAVVRDLGGTPIDVQRDFKGAVLEGITRLRSRNRLGALRAMRTVEKLTNRGYHRAAEVAMPPIGQAIVMEYLAEERHHLASLEAHLARLTGSHYYDVDRIDREASEPLYPP